MYRSAYTTAADIIGAPFSCQLALMLNEDGPPTLRFLGEQRQYTMPLTPVQVDSIVNALQQDQAGRRDDGFTTVVQACRHCGGSDIRTHRDTR